MDKAADAVASHPDHKYCMEEQRICLHKHTKIDFRVSLCLPVFSFGPSDSVLVTEPRDNGFQCAVELVPFHIVASIPVVGNRYRT